MDQPLSVVESAADAAVALLTTYGLNVIGAVVILIAGLWLSGRAQALLSNALLRSHRIDPTLIGFFANLLKYLIQIFTLIAVLSQFGVQTASLLTVLGTAGLAVGLAMQGTLSNIAAGVMLLIFRPFHVGDTVEVAGQVGTVKLLNLFFTELATPDNIKLIIPNGQIWGATLKNISANPVRRLDLSVRIAADADLDKALDILRGVVEADERIMKSPPPNIAIGELGHDAITLRLELWLAASDFGAVQSAALKAVRQRLEAGGIERPLTTRRVFLTDEREPSPARRPV